MRAVLDPNVLISAALSPKGPPAELIRRWGEGDFELLVSPLLLTELRRALAYPKLSRRISSVEAQGLLELLGAEAEHLADPGVEPPVRSADPGDDYLITLSADVGAALVSGDRHLLDLSGELPIYSPAAFLDLLRGTPGIG